MTSLTVVAPVHYASMLHLNYASMSHLAQPIFCPVLKELSCIQPCNTDAYIVFFINLAISPYEHKTIYKYKNMFL